MLYCGSPFSWFTRKQTLVSESSTEAEFVAAAETTKDALWAQPIHAKITGRTAPITLCLDNKSAIDTILNPEHHGWTKHIDICKKCAVRNQVHHYGIDVKDIGTAEMTADINTKALGGSKLEQHCKAFGLE